MRKKICLTAAALIGVAATMAGAKRADALVVLGPPPLQSNFTFPDGERGFALATSGGFVNPEVIVGFNPQPDPPGDNSDNTLNLVNPSDPLLHSGFQGSNFGFAISFLGIGNPIIAPAPNATSFSFHTVISDHNHTFTVTVHFTDNQGNPAASIDWGAFNPQPDPPGDVEGAAVQFASVDADVSFQITEDNAPLSFALVPEPASVALLGFALAGLGIARRRRA